MMKREEILFEDFREVKDIVLKEKLSEEEIEEGLEPLESFFKVCITGHAFNRMYGEQERYAPYELVEDLIVSKATEIINTSTNEEFILLSSDKKLAVPCIIQKIEGEYAIIIKTVIRKVYYKDGIECEKTVGFRKCYDNKIK